MVLFTKFINWRTICDENNRLNLMYITVVNIFFIFTFFKYINRVLNYFLTIIYVIRCAYVNQFLASKKWMLEKIHFPIKIHMMKLNGPWYLFT